MRKLPRKTHDDDDEGISYYDRKLCRELIFLEKLPIPEGLVHDVEIFGLPVPKWPYWKNSEFTVKDKASEWVYRQREPRTQDAGRVAPEPNSQLLPRLLQEEALTPTIVPEGTSTSPVIIPSVAETIPRQRETTPVDLYEMLIFEDSPPLEPTTVSVNSEAEIKELPLAPRNEIPSNTQSPKPPTQEPEASNNDKMDMEEDARTVEGNPREDSSYEPQAMDPPSQNNPFSKFWETDFKSPIPPPSAPCSLLRITGTGDASLVDFRAFLYRTLLWMKTTKEITIARIVRMVVNQEVQFWLKVYDQEQAGWVVRAYHRMTTEKGERLKIGLVSLNKWRETVDITGDTQWCLPSPLHPHMSTPEDPEGPPPRKRRTLENRLQDQASPRASLMERLGEKPTASGSNRQRRNKGRGGARKKWFLNQHGPLHTEDPTGWETWDGYQWLQDYEYSMQ
ncbi:hypothetical protein VKT23_006351 [Stygiomarasmius scandens]|uniref:Uncharacterized protein n=1 Tax=Marasmiellus scandens TaxID=2682957 RepID=A0ABR1JML2_9AGAR